MAFAAGGNDERGYGNNGGLGWGLEGMVSGVVASAMLAPGWSVTVSSELTIFPFCLGCEELVSLRRESEQSCGISRGKSVEILPRVL